MSYTEVFAWGSDEEGQLGLGDNRSRRYYQFPRFCSFNALIQQVACGKDHSAMIASNGFLYTMGSNAFGKLGIGVTARGCVAPSLVDALSTTRIKNVSCGFNHTVCCSENGELFSWGDNSSGQLGVGEGVYQSPAPRKIDLPTLISNVSCGNYHTIVYNQNSVLAFGLGEQGQLGLGSAIERQYKPAVLQKLPGSITQVAAGNYFTLFLIQNRLYGCGDNQYGQLGINKSNVRALAPQKSTSSGLDKSNIFQIFQNYLVTFTSIQVKSYSAALSIDNDLYLFGSLSLQEPIKIPCPSKVKNYAIGSAFGVLIDMNGRAFSWGEISKNIQLIEIEALFDKKISKIAAGEQHIMAIGGNVGVQKSQSQSRISSDGRRSDQSGKISRQQSAAQLNAMLAQQRNQTEYNTNQLQKQNKTFNEDLSKQQKRPFQHYRTKENIDDVEGYKTLQQQVYASNQRAITPTQNRKYNAAKNPLQNSNIPDKDFESLNSNVGSKINLFMKQQQQTQMNEDSEEPFPQYQRKMEDRCRSEYTHNYVRQRLFYLFQKQSPTRVFSRQIVDQEFQNKFDELTQQLNQLKSQVQEKENQVIVIQSEYNDSKIKLTRRIRQLEDMLEQKDKQIGKQEQLQQQSNQQITREKELNIFKLENQKLLDKIKQLEQEKFHHEMHEKNSKSRQQLPPPPSKLKCQQSGQKKVEESESFLLSQVTEQSPNKKTHGKQEQLAKEFLRISPIVDKQQDLQQPQAIKTLSNYEMDESLEFRKDEDRIIRAKTKEQEQSPNKEMTPSRTKKVEHESPPLPQRIQAPTKNTQNQQQSNDWWSNDRERKDMRPQTNIKQREPSYNPQQQNSEVLKNGSGYKQNILTLNSKLTDIRKTKSALENRMKQFEEKIKDRKKLENEK